MISSLKASDQQFLYQLNRISDRMSSAQRQISTGVKLASVGDDPDQVSTLLNARANLAAAEQIQSNLGRVTAEVDAAEQALQTAVQLFERVRSLGTQGATGTQSAGSRLAIAQEISGVLEQMVALTGTQVEGRYIFSGDSDRTAPYTLDWSQAPALSTFQGAASTREIQHPNGTTFRVGHTAEEIFDSPVAGRNVFSRVMALHAALESNDEASIRDALDALSTAGDHLNNELAFYGTSQNKVRAADEFGRNLQLQLRMQIGQIADADLTEAILELTQGQTQQQAALSSRAQLPRQTLFDYLG
jgi:flagellar hook-associated protein 3 FlgL